MEFNTEELVKEGSVMESNAELVILVMGSIMEFSTELVKDVKDDGSIIESSAEQVKDIVSAAETGNALVSRASCSIWSAICMKEKFHYYYCCTHNKSQKRE